MHGICMVHASLLLQEWSPGVCVLCMLLVAGVVFVCVTVHVVSERRYVGGAVFPILGVCTVQDGRHVWDVRWLKNVVYVLCVCVVVCFCVVCWMCWMCCVCPVDIRKKWQ